MNNYHIIIEYLGFKYVGWQVQKKGNSIQSVIEKALRKTLKLKVKIIGSGRTDAGVNAFGQSANFFCQSEIKNKFKFLSSVNFFLRNQSISILDIKKKNAKFHARYSAKKRLYEYIILNRSAKPTIDLHRSWFVRKKLDVKKMKKAIKYFVGSHNFSALRASSCTATNPVRTISFAKIKKNRDKLIIQFESKSFLQKQVRSMVGCLKYVGEDRWTPQNIKKIIKLKRRDFCAPPAPSHGLFLKKVFY